MLTAFVSYRILFDQITWLFIGGHDSIWPVNSCAPAVVWGLAITRQMLAC